MEKEKINQTQSFPLYKINERYKVIFNENSNNANTRVLFLTLKYVEDQMLHFEFDDGSPLMIGKLFISSMKLGPKPGDSK